MCTRHWTVVVSERLQLKADGCTNIYTSYDIILNFMYMTYKYVNIFYTFNPLLDHIIYLL